MKRIKSNRKSRSRTFENYRSHPNLNLNPAPNHLPNLNLHLTRTRFLVAELNTLIFILFFTHFVPAEFEHADITTQ